MKIADLRTEATRRTHIDIVQRVEDTFGPNPCQQLKLEHEDGTTMLLPCNGKRCIHCGPRKEMTIWLQVQTVLGEYAYVERLSNNDQYRDVERGIERAKKDVQRGRSATTYQIVGDETLGRIVVSSKPLTPRARLMKLSEWKRRIIDMYHHSVNRIRRSFALGRVSLVPLRRTTKSGQPSPWRYKSQRVSIREAVLDTVMERRDALTEEVGWHVWFEGRRLVSTIDAWR